MNAKIIKSNYFIVLLILLCVFSCLKKGNEKSDDLYKEKKKDIVEKIKTTYEGIVCLDTVFTYHLFSIDMQEKYCGIPILIGDFIIEDIYKSKEEHHAFLRLLISDIYVDLILSQKELEKLKTSDKFQVDDNLLIVAVLNDVRKMKFIIDAFEYDELAHIEINSSYNFIATGNILDIKNVK